MKFGIKQTPDGILCENCNALITTKATYNENYCSHCGNPLTAQAMQDYIDVNYRTQEDLINKIEKGVQSGLTIEAIITSLREQIKKHFEE